MQIPADKLSYKGMKISCNKEQTEFWITDHDTYRAPVLVLVLDMIDGLTKPVSDKELEKLIAEDWHRTQGR